MLAVSGKAAPSRNSKPQRRQRSAPLVLRSTRLIVRAATAACVASAASSALDCFSTSFAVPRISQPGLAYGTRAALKATVPALRAPLMPHRASNNLPSRTALAMGPILKSVLIVPNLLLLISGIAIWRGRPKELIDGDKMQDMWESYSERPIARQMALGAGAVRVGIVALRARFAKDPAKKSALFSQAGAAAVKELVKLGPTYMKLGQIVSCRPDLVPDECVEELKLLQDQVPAFGGARARKILEEQLGKPVDELFSEFDDVPLAAASLGQVHRAKTIDGEQVAIKLQRGKLKEIYDRDLVQFDKICKMLDKYKIGVKGAGQNWTEIFEESKVILYREIDYTAEAENMSRSAENFKEIKWAKVPGIIPELTTSQVLTMEFVPGIKISDLEKLDATAGIDRELLSKRLAQAYLLQFCKHGFFNTDPHPGNLAADTAVEGGRLILYDFGQSCALTDAQCDGILQVIQSIVDLEASACVEAMQKLGTVKPGANIQKITALIDNNFKTGKVKSKRSNRKREMTEEEVGDAKVPGQMETMGYLQLPSQLAFVARAITQMNGVGVMLDEDFEFIDSIAEKVPEIQMERGAGLGYLAGQMFKQLTRNF